MSIAFAVEMRDKLQALSDRIAALEAQQQPIPAEACTEIEPKKRGRPAKEKVDGTATPAA